ncbi:MAG: hypothetical protein HGA86_06655 [Anaerolineaceae bacterium]|nr:hypothetical protein [Anaerolineaceae bacterium]
MVFAPQAGAEEQRQHAYRGDAHHQQCRKAVRPQHLHQAQRVDHDPPGGSDMVGSSHWHTGIHCLSSK